MNNIVLLFVCVLIGMGLRAAKKAPENAHLALNAFIIHISLPALIILQIHNVKLHTSLLGCSSSASGFSGRFLRG